MESESLDVRRYFALLLNWWWLLVLGAVFGGVAAYFFSINQTPIYETDTTILVQQSQTALPTQADIATSQSLARTYQELIRTRPVLQEVIQQLDLSYRPNDLKGKTSVSLIRDTQLLRITVKDPDPQIAADIANTLAVVFIDRTTQGFLAGVARMQAAAKAQGIADPAPLVAMQLEALGILSQVEEAVPASFPVLPRTRTNIVIAIVLGSLVALSLIVILENLTDTVRSPERVERAFGLSNLGIVPFWRSTDVTEGEVVVAQRRQSPHAEAYRQIRANIEFAMAGKKANVFMVTSPGAGEGKTSTVANLAAVVAQSGKSVIVVDADLRRPNLHRYFGVQSHNMTGLSTALAIPEHVVQESLQSTTLPGVRLLASGPTPPNPGELLGLDRMVRILQDLRTQADIVLVDSPPVLVAADSVILASQVDGVILVTDTERTRMDSLKVAVESLRKTDGLIVGVVLNKLKPKRFSYYGNQYPYYYYYYSHYYKSDPDESEDSLETRNGLPKSFAGRIRNRIGRIVGRGSA